MAISAATPQGTRTYFERYPLSVPAVELGGTGLLVSPVGFGGYRIQERSGEHAEALRDALLSGCNLIDTSANYGDGGSERLVGRVLAELFAQNKLERDQVVVVTKAGYVQGDNQRLARARAAEGRPFAEMTEFSPDCWHCISPGFLADQITRSLDRLGLERLDALLLHNPEYFLKAGGEHAEYYARIEAAFRHLETEVEAGRIARYGVSSNTFPESREEADFTSLEVLCEIASRIRADHRFELVQFPMNLFEPGAALEENNGTPASGGARTLAEFARAKGLGTLVNRPLNAFAERRLVRLADFPHHVQRDIVGDFKSAMNRATALEAKARTLPVQARDVAWGHILRENFERLNDIDTWKSFLQHRVEPTLEGALETLSRSETSPEHAAWAREYREASRALFDAFTAYLEEQASVVSDRVAGQLDHLCPELADSATLSQKVIRLYRSVPGVDCILVGMRQTRYVRDTLALKPPVGWDKARMAFVGIQREAIFS